MNKYQEALNNVRKVYVESDHYDEEDIRLLQELVDKEKPMKPREAIDSRDRFTHYYCPKCNKKTILIPQEFCLNCGQKLDWSDEE